MTDPLYNPVLPFVHPLRSGLFPGQLIKIQGSPLPGANCFAINLQTGPSLDHRDDIALHMSPVFTPPPRVVRNSLQSHRWGPEESHGGFPFVPNQNFEIIILVEREQFKIAINGYHFTEFRHRLPFHLISYISVDGDARINSVTFEGSATSHSSSVPSAPPPPIGANPPPYPTGPATMPPYPTSGHVNYQGSQQYAPTYAPSGQYPAQTGIVPPQYAYPPSGATGGYPTQVGGPAYPAAVASYPIAGPAYPSAGPAYATQGMAYPSAGPAYATQGMAYPSAVAGYPSTSYVQQSHKKSSLPIPISGNVAGIAAGVGAAALGAAMLHGHPFKKMKKLYKHKFKKPKFFKHKFGKFGKWKHKGWSSDSSSCDD